MDSSEKTGGDAGALLTTEEPGGPWGGYDFKRPSRAVVARGEGGSIVLWTVGGHVRMDMEEHGLRDPAELMGEPERPGLWVWEGKHVWIPGSWECPQDGSLELEGLFRQLTPDEHAAVLGGRSPWNDEDWKLA